MTHRLYGRTTSHSHRDASFGCNCALAKVMGSRKSVAEKSSGVAVVQEFEHCQCRTGTCIRPDLGPEDKENEWRRLH
jgi:hypothetical protein